MVKAIFLDRDGTINIDKGYVYRKEDFKFLPGALCGLRLLYRAGYTLFIITNQSGIGRGYYSINDYQKLMKWVERILEKNGSPITKSYFCPHLPDAVVSEYRMECQCRKPKIGLYEQAISEWNIDLEHSYVIGDSFRDLTLCLDKTRKTLCRGYLIGNNEETEVLQKVKQGEYEMIDYADSLLDASRIIIKK